MPPCPLQLHWWPAGLGAAASCAGLSPAALRPHTHPNARHRLVEYQSVKQSNSITGSSGAAPAAAPSSSTTSSGRVAPPSRVVATPTEASSATKSKKGGGFVSRQAKGAPPPPPPAAPAAPAAAAAAATTRSSRGKAPKPAAAAAAAAPSDASPAAAAAAPSKGSPPEPQLPRTVAGARHEAFETKLVIPTTAPPPAVAADAPAAAAAVVSAPAAPAPADVEVEASAAALSVALPGGAVLSDILAQLVTANDDVAAAEDHVEGGRLWGIAAGCSAGCLSLLRSPCWHPLREPCSPLTHYQAWRACCTRRAPRWVSSRLMRPPPRAAPRPSAARRSTWWAS
jgi:hypothetical protein